MSGHVKGRNWDVNMHVMDEEAEVALMKEDICDSATEKPKHISLHQQRFVHRLTD